MANQTTIANQIPQDPPKLTVNDLLLEIRKAPNGENNIEELVKDAHSIISAPSESTNLGSHALTRLFLFIYKRVTGDEKLDLASMAAQIKQFDDYLKQTKASASAQGGRTPCF